MQVVSILPKVHEHMKAHGLDLKKLHIIPNGIVEEEWQTNQLENLTEGKLKQFLEEMKQQGKFIVGALDRMDNLNALRKHLIDAAKMVESKDPSVVFVLVGSGLEKQKS